MSACYQHAHLRVSDRLASGTNDDSDHWQESQCEEEVPMYSIFSDMLLQKGQFWKASALRCTTHGIFRPFHHQNPHNAKYPDRQTLPYDLLQR